MPRYPLFIVSLAALFAVGCAPASSISHAVNPWSSDFDTAIDRCSAMAEPSGSTARAGCEKLMNRLIADEKKYRKSYCYTVIDRIVCKKNALDPYNAALALYTSRTDYSDRR